MKRYQSLVHSLPEPEFLLLEERVRILQKTIRPGAKRHNWNSLAISDYINRCEEALSTFESFVTQVCTAFLDISMATEPAITAVLASPVIHIFYCISMATGNYVRLGNEEL